MSKHTPGPWEITGGFVVGPACNAIAKIHQQASPSVTLANARLIVAAPELLEALRMIAAETTVDGTEREELCATIQGLCRAAIAKATGGQP